jgi:hypothetical protein
VMIYDGNLSEKVKQEGGSRHLRALSLDSWFTSPSQFYIAVGSSRFFLRILMRFLSVIHREKILKEKDLNIQGLRPVFFVQDYFGDKNFVLNLNRNAVLRIMDNQRSFFNSVDKSKVAAIHIRLTDFYKVDKEPLSKDDYSSAINEFSEYGVTRFDCYSDDLLNAKLLLPIDDGTRFSFPEESNSLNSIELLHTLAMYDYIIASRSTLCWWACYLSTLRNPNVIVKSFWDEKLSLITWKI